MVVLAFCRGLFIALEKPKAMKMMPKRVVNKIANGITQNRIREMADGFIKNSIDSFPLWYKNDPFTP